MKLRRLLPKPPLLALQAGASIQGGLGSAAMSLPEIHPFRRALAQSDGVLASDEPFPPGTARLLDLGEKGMPPGIFLLLRTREGGSALEPVWAAWGIKRPVVNLVLRPKLRRLLGGRNRVKLSEARRLLHSERLLESSVDLSARVEHALTPFSFRVYPNTPVRELRRLMVRRGLSSVAVVGSELELLGVVTACDLLPHCLGKRGDRERAAQKSALTTADVMSRTVMCVSENDRLGDAAREMARRRAECLAVVREGRFVGFLRRETVMQAFDAP